MRWSQRRKARTLALLRQLASWRFDEKATMRDQLVRYEEAPRTYEASEWQAFSGGCGAGGVGDWTREPLHSQVQLKLSNDTKTKKANVREWILQYESLTTPGASLCPTRAAQAASRMRRSPWTWT